MTEETALQYWQRRERVAVAAADAAADPGVRAVHNRFAKGYRNRINSLAQDQGPDAATGATA